MRRLLLGFVFFISIAIPFSGFADNLKPQYGGIIKHDVRFLPKAVGYPSAMVNFADWEQALPALETLLRYDKQKNMVGLLATAWEASPDFMTIKLTLRKGVKFHDGTEFNAEAVKWNLDTYRNSKKPELKSIGSVDILDDYTIQMNMARFDSQILRSLCEWAGLMISPSAVKQYGEEYFLTHSVGTGPFILEKYDPGVIIKYKRNENYWQEGKPYLDGMEFFTIVDDMVSLASFKSGEVQTAYIASEDIIKQGETATKGRILNQMMTCFCLIGDSIHPNSPWYNLKVRQAAAHAIDNKTLTKTLRGEFVQPTNQMARSDTPYYNPDIKGYTYNPERAKQLLVEAGYPNGFSTTITYPTTKQGDLEMAAIQSYLAKVNIKAELKPVPFPQYLEVRIKGFSGLVPSKFDVIKEREPFSELIKRLSNRSAIFSSSVYFPDEYIDTINKASEEIDFEARMKFNRELVRMVSEKYLIMIPLYLDGDKMLVDKKLHNIGFYEYWAHQWNPEEVWIER